MKGVGNVELGVGSKEAGREERVGNVEVGSRRKRSTGDCEQLGVGNVEFGVDERSRE